MPGLPGSRFNQSPLNVYVGGSGRLSFVVQGASSYSDPGVSYNAQRNQYSTVPKFSVGGIQTTANQWNYLIFKMRWGRSANSGTGIQVWMAQGSGAAVQLFEWQSVQFGYFDMPPNTNYPKAGLYQWSLPGTERSSWTKGLQIYRDVSGSPALDVDSVLATVRALESINLVTQRPSGSSEVSSGRQL
jgi:hypothetical protein